MAVPESEITEGIALLPPTELGVAAQSDAFIYSTTGLESRGTLSKLEAGQTQAGHTLAALLSLLPSAPPRRAVQADPSILGLACPCLLGTLYRWGEVALALDTLGSSLSAT